MTIRYHKIFILILFVILVYTRFVNLPWGLPYPMHPDERNMAVAISQLSCAQLFSHDCLNPHFFAYGQLPLYVSYFGVTVYRALTFSSNISISYSEAVIALRFISAISSLVTVLLMLKILYALDETIKKTFFKYVAIIIFIFSPGLIQFSHFGTTESLLMFFYTSILYLSMRFVQKEYSHSFYIFGTSFLLGLAIGTKISSIIFAGVPFVAFLIDSYSSQSSRKLLRFCFSLIKMLSLASIFSILSSPYNFIQFGDFLGSISYESDIATGRYVAFYIRQFVATMPVFFQFQYIFPYALGWGIFILSIAGFFLLPYTHKNNLLRFAFLLYFLPTAFLFSKWTRFISPVLPVMLIMATYLLFKIFSLVKISRFLKGSFFALLTLMLCLPGIAYLSIYQTADVRFTASDWVFKNIPSNSYIFSETANVVDIPIQAPYYPENYYAGKTYKYISFNLYDIDTNLSLQNDLQTDLQQAEYIFVPSRRIFMNHTCYNEKLSVASKIDRSNDCTIKSKDYPALQSYYDNLFSGKLGFEKVAEFSSYPSISLFGKKFLEFPDETAEESWTVFDHPVIRIFKRVQSH